MTVIYSAVLGYGNICQPKNILGYFSSAKYNILCIHLGSHHRVIILPQIGTHVLIMEYVYSIPEFEFVHLDRYLIYFLTHF